jgi:predicted RNA binding protein YcfA (HicA-like mRNA interferase family)
MSKLPILSGQEVIKILSKIGYRIIRQKGSHIRLDCSRPGIKKVTVPSYKSIDVNLLARILRNAEIAEGEFLKLLEK